MTTTSILQPVIHNTDPLKLPAEHRERWALRRSTFEGYMDDERRRWREWFAWATGEGGELWDPLTRCARLVGVSLAGADLSRMDLTGADLERANLIGADLSWAGLSGVNLTSARLEGAILARATLVRATLNNTRLAKADLTGADLSEATIHRIDMTGVDLRDARLFATRITEPVWWCHLPRIAGSWRVVFADGIPEHPIQDVVGLPPLLRRQIADVQHLRDVYRKSHGAGRRLIWIWGLTCNFGQSLARLALTAVVIVGLFVLLYMLTDFSLQRPNADGTDMIRYVGHPSFAQSLYFAVTTFTAPGTSGMVPVGELGKVLLAAQGVVCFLLLGGVMSIFANKLARLS